MKTYYNEWDLFCAQWLRNLMASGHIAAAKVDERSICDVHTDDLRAYGNAIDPRPAAAFIRSFKEVAIGCAP